MADSPSNNSSRSSITRLDRSGLERVLARAAELQSGAGDTDEQFSEQQLIELGKEVGLSAQALRQALAEEQTRSSTPEDERGLAATLFGRGRVGASRVVAGRAPDVLAAIDTWMQQQELLIVKRHHSDRIVWEPRRDLLVGLKRLFRAGGRDYALSQAFEVSATVFAVDDNQIHVALDADFQNHRAKMSRQALGSSLLGGMAAASLFAIGVTVTALAAAPLVIMPAIGIGAARAMQRHVVTRAQLALEQLLDRLERGDHARRGPESILSAIVAAATALPPRRY
jgi:hypothetical protein